MSKDSTIDFSAIQKDMAEHPDDYFSAEETDRRMNGCLRRLSGKPPTMNMRTGQNLKEPLFSDGELRKRGYPCEDGWGD